MHHIHIRAIPVMNPYKTELTDSDVSTCKAKNSIFSTFFRNSNFAEHSFAWRIRYKIFFLYDFCLDIVSIQVTDQKLQLFY